MSSTQMEASRKPDQDFSETVNKQLPELENQAKSNLQGALESLHVLEKQTRQASDLPSTQKVILTIVTLCKDAGDWSLLNDQVVVLSKKHGQLKQAMTRMVQVVMGWLHQTPNTETRLSAIETLRTITEGKIHLEVERARVTKMLSDIKEEQGDAKEASDILCELQVETFGSMSRREKTEFILQQVDLLIKTGDHTQAGIFSQKISAKYISRKPKKPKEEEQKEKKADPDKEKKDAEEEKEQDDNVTDLKLKYYEQRILLSKVKSDYLQICKDYRAVLDTADVENDSHRLQIVLQSVICFILLSPHSNEQHDLLQRISLDSRNKELVPNEADLLKRFNTSELMRWPAVLEKYGPQLCATNIFKPTKQAAVESGEESAYDRWEDLCKRIIEHNVRVVSKYYTRIRLARLAELLDLDEETTEKRLSDMVTAKMVFARIDRPARMVTFQVKRDAEDVLNEWSSDMRNLLGLLERIDHLITKEEMMARIQPVSKTVKSKG